MQSTSGASDSATLSEPFFDKMLSSIPTPVGEIPILSDVWEFFCMKGAKTVYYSINPEHSLAVDVEFSEALGCPLNVLTTKPVVESRWETIRKTLKQRKIAEEDKNETWLEGIQKRWILPKNIFTKSVPSFTWNTLRDLKLERIDLLKIESTAEEEESTRMILYSMLDLGFRPGLLLFNIHESPNKAVAPMLLAAHLQNAGYRLLKTRSSWFLYSFTDVCVYESCSWEDSTTQNPLIKFLVELIKTKLKKSMSPIETPPSTE